jgi:3'-phosphoadenosine 5'-phosphosulfate sulfotransferase (PAPS reductase)/FAD synthetase
MDFKLLESKDIFEKAIYDFKPDAIVMMFSGGDDSLTTYHVAKELGIKFDFIIHGNTRTGITETTEFAIKEVERMKDKLIIADAGNTYETYVMRKGFFGKGLGAHAFSYHRLKQEHFEKVVAHHLRQRRRNYRIIFINGARRQESKNRLITMASPFKITKRRPNDMWVNLINEFTKDDCKSYLEGNCIKRNPVSINLCRSGECMCGTMQSIGDRIEAGFFYPKWKKWLDELEIKAIDKHGWGWNDNKPQPKDYNHLNLFQPMCTGCKINYENIVV